MHVDDKMAQQNTTMMLLTRWHSSLLQEAYYSRKPTLSKIELEYCSSLQWKEKRILIW